MPQAIEPEDRKQRLLEDLAALDPAEAQVVSNALGLQNPNTALPTGAYQNRGWERVEPTARPARDRLAQLGEGEVEALDSRLGIQGPNISAEQRTKREQEIKDNIQGPKISAEQRAEREKEVKSGKTAIDTTSAPKQKKKGSESAPNKGFDQLLEGALAGDKNAVALVNSIGRLNGFDKIQITKDGIQYQENGEWKTADVEDMRGMFDQAVKGIGYWEQLAAKSRVRQSPSQAPRQAIPTDLDPAVLRALRAKAILKGDVGDLVAYQRMPSQIDEAAASILYRRAAAQRALQAARRGALQEYEYEYLDDGSRLKLDKNTKERLELRDPKGRLAPISRVGQMDSYSKELDAMIAEAEEDGAELIPNGTDNPTVKLPGGRKVSWTQYQLAKEKAKTVPRGQGNVGTASTGEAK